MKTVVLFNIFCVNRDTFLSQDSLMIKKFRTAFIIIFNILNVFTVTFDQFNWLLLYKNMNFLKKNLTNP